MNFILMITAFIIMMRSFDHYSCTRSLGVCAFLIDSKLQKFSIAVDLNIN